MPARPQEARDWLQIELAAIDRGLVELQLLLEREAKAPTGIIRWTAQLAAWLANDDAGDDGARRPTKRRCESR